MQHIFGNRNAVFPPATLGSRSLSHPAPLAPLEGAISQLPQPGEQQYTWFHYRAGPHALEVPELPGRRATRLRAPDHGPPGGSERLAAPDLPPLITAGPVVTVEPLRAHASGTVDSVDASVASSSSYNTAGLDRRSAPSSSGGGIQALLAAAFQLATRDGEGGEGGEGIAIDPDLCLSAEQRVQRVYRPPGARVCFGGCGKKFARSQNRESHWDCYPECGGRHLAATEGTRGAEEYTAYLQRRERQRQDPKKRYRKYSLL